MTENNTVGVLESTGNTGYNLIWLYFIWICFFFTTALPNMIVTLTIMRYKALRTRKEYLVMAGLSLADFFEIMGFSICGIYRLVLIFTDQFNKTVSSWYCVTVVQNVFWWFSKPVCGCMLIMVSVDRFISVYFPVKYYLLTKTYAHRMLSLIYGFGVFMCLLFLVLAFVEKQEHSVDLPIACYSGATVLAVNDYYASFYMSVTGVTGVISVVLYVGVGVGYGKKKQQLITPTNAGQSKMVQDQKRQKQLTKNLALSCLCTTIFLVIPSALSYFAEIGLLRWFQQILWLLPPINPFCNIIIYYKRQPELKNGMKALLINKMMPGNLNLWNPISASSNQKSAGVGNPQGIGSPRGSENSKGVGHA